MGGGVIRTICDGLLGSVYVNGMDVGLVIQLYRVSTLIYLEYTIRIEWDAMHLSLSCQKKNIYIPL